MKIIDISRNLLQCRVYEKDTPPTTTLVQDIDSGYRLTDINMCLHNGTHIDAPSHFLAEGDSIGQVDLSKCIGRCIVVRVDCDIDRDVVDSLPMCDRVLFDGRGQIVDSGASALVHRGVVLVGIARMSVANAQYAYSVHHILLGGGALILEGLELSHVAVGVYHLVALPLNIDNAEASPVRAVLVEGK